MRPSGSSSRLTLVLRVCGTAAVAGFIAIAFTPLPNLLARSADRPRPRSADAIVVLGGRVQPGGILGADSFRRTVEGIVLYRRGLAPVLVFSGSLRRGQIPENVIRLELARDLGVPREAILTESGASTTRDEARRLHVLLWPRGVRRILLVSDSQHLARAAPVFRRAGFDVEPVAADFMSTEVADPSERLELGRELAQEWAARVYYRAVGQR